MQFFINCYAQNEIAAAARLCELPVQRSKSRVLPVQRWSGQWR
jgi:hypothetical protein